MAKYPRIGEVRRIHPPRGVCVVCGAKATHKVDIQYTYMRGDDDVKRVCDESLTGTQASKCCAPERTWTVGEPPLFTDEQIEDMAHRLRCLVDRESRACICADYAAVTGLLHPDCPQHGYVQRPKAQETRR